MRKARSLILSCTILIVAISYGRAQAQRLFKFTPALTLTVPAGTAIHAATGNVLKLPMPAGQSMHIIHASANVRDQLNSQSVIADSVNILLQTNGTTPLNFSLAATANAGLVLGECNAFLNDFTLLSTDFAANGGINPVNLVATSSLRNVDTAHAHAIVMQFKIFYEIVPTAAVAREMEEPSN